MLQNFWSLIWYSPSRVFVLDFWVSHHASSAPETPPIPPVGPQQPPSYDPLPLAVDNLNLAVLRGTQLTRDASLLALPFALLTDRLRQN